MARQVLKKVLVGPIKVTPDVVPAATNLERNAEGVLVLTMTPAPGWTFEGYSRFEKAISGGLTYGNTNIAPISGGSDAGVPAAGSTDMAPIPHSLVTPRRSRGAPRSCVCQADAA